MLIEPLMQSVRNEITNSVEKSYSKLSCKALAEMLMINNMNDIKIIANEVYYYKIEKMDYSK